MTRDPVDAGTQPNRARQVVATIVCAESIVVIVYGSVLGIGTLVSRPSSLLGSVVLSFLVVLLGVGVASVGVGIWRGQRWSRSPALVWQGLQAAVGVPALPVRPLIGVPLVLAAVLVAGGLFVPGVVEGPGERAGGEGA